MSDKFLSKIVKKNYNNQLEQVLSKKDYPEEVKNTLLSIFYKIENGYNDYQTIKRQTDDKKEYIEKLISIIQNDCDQIQFISQKSNEEEKVDREKKQIICYPIETHLLYALSQIRKKNIMVQYLDEIIEEAMSNLLGIGNNINIVEPFRDFNGFSWNIITKDIPDLNYNLLYQSILLLVGNQLIDKWANNSEPIIDYFDLFQGELEKKYGKEIKDKIVKLLIQLAIELKVQNDEELKHKIQNKVNTIKKETKDMENKEQFLLKIANKKKRLERQIKKIDTIINDKNLLIAEYERRNEKLPLEKKIFSIRVLKNTLKEERKKMIEQIKEYNHIMKPKVFLEKKKILEQKLEYMDTLEKLSPQNTFKKEIDLQKEMIKCMHINLKNAKERKDIINSIYQYRYYNFLPVNNRKNIGQIKGLENNLNTLIKEIIDKALEMKIINRILNNDEQNYLMTKDLFLSKIITLEDINIKPLSKNNEIYLTIYDEEIEDTKIKLETITKEEINIKFNKKTKLFI